MMQSTLTLATDITLVLTTICFLIHLLGHIKLILTVKSLSLIIFFLSCYYFVDLLTSTAWKMNVNKEKDGYYS